MDNQKEMMGPVVLTQLGLIVVAQLGLSVVTGAVLSSASAVPAQPRTASTPSCLSSAQPPRPASARHDPATTSNCRSSSSARAVPAQSRTAATSVIGGSFSSVLFSPSQLGNSSFLEEKVTPSSYKNVLACRICYHPFTLICGASSFSV
ncbi:hypothetical protein ACFE04_011343 [Oxalis oulophora]